MKEYSAQILSISARLKFWKGISMPCIAFSSSARYEDIAIRLLDLRMSIRWPRAKGSWLAPAVRPLGNALPNESEWWDHDSRPRSRTYRLSEELGHHLKGHCDLCCKVLFY